MAETIPLSSSRLIPNSAAANPVSFIALAKSAVATGAVACTATHLSTAAVTLSKNSGKTSTTEVKASTASAVLKLALAVRSRVA